LSSHQKLLVLDLDETLVHASEFELSREADFCVGQYFVYERPHVNRFISHVLERFHVGVWTASGEHYAAQVVARLFPANVLKFVWSSQRCTTVRDWSTGGYQTIKKLEKLKAKGYRLESIIAVDDTPAKHARNFGNLVTVREFTGDEGDNELLLLMRYLDHLAEMPNIRTVEKRRWRDVIHNNSEEHIGPHAVSNNERM
jgi:carboxy-terminal domain RNA polymerase II polypeptide A small phosphatase